MKKIILILFVLIFLSACTATSNVEIDKEGKVTEEVVLSENKSNFSSDSYIKGMINSYLELYEYDLENYSYEDISDDNYLKIKLKRSYDDICSYFTESSFTKKALSNVSCQELNNTYEIKANINSLSCEGNCLEGPLVDNIEFSLKLPEAAVFENANESEGNLYMWHISEGNLSNINLIINKMDTQKINNNEKEDSNFILNVFIILFILLLVLFLVIYLLRKYKKNKLEY